MKKLGKIQDSQFRSWVLYPVSNIIDISNLQYEVIILQKKMIARHFDKVDFSNTCYAWKSTPLQYCTANSKIGS